MWFLLPVVGIIIVVAIGVFPIVDGQGASCSRCADETHYYALIQKSSSYCTGIQDETINLQEIYVYSSGNLLTNAQVSITGSSVYVSGPAYLALDY